MPLGEQPTTSVLGEDKNQVPLMGGTDGTDVLTLEMTPGSAPGLGVAKVDTSGTAGATLIAPSRVSVAAAATQVSAVSVPCKEVVLKNDDGGDPQGNTETIFIGISNAVTTGTGFPVRLGESITVPAQDLNELWAISASGGQVLAIFPIN